MNEEARRQSDNWDRQEALVLKTLNDLRMSSDAALKMGGELKEAVAVMRAEMKGTWEQMSAETKSAAALQQSQIDDLESWRESITKWVMGIVATLVVAAIMYAVTQFGQIAQIKANSDRIDRNELRFGMPK